MSTAVKVAFATSDLKHVDQHFGAARSFALYAVDPGDYAFLEVVEFPVEAMDGNEDKLGRKIESLQGCIAVYSQAIGASAVSQLQAIRIQPVKVSAGAEIDELLQALQAEMREGPGSWLARALSANTLSDPSRFDAMEEEGWQE